MSRIVCTYAPQNWNRKVLLPTVAEGVVIGGSNVAMCVYLGIGSSPIALIVLLGGLVVTGFILRMAYTSRKRAFSRRKLSFALENDRLEVIDERGDTIQTLRRTDVLAIRSSSTFEWTKGDDPPTRFWTVDHRGGSFEFDERLAYGRELREFLGIEYVKAGKFSL